MPGIIGMLLALGLTGLWIIMHEAGFPGRPMQAYATITIVNVLIGWALGRVHSEILSRSTTDYLTGVSNRHRFMPEFDKQIALAQRNGHPLSLLLIDINNFKQCNDSRGHLEGDRILTNVARAIQKAVRETDTVGPCCVPKAQRNHCHGYSRLGFHWLCHLSHEWFDTRCSAATCG